jgi:hypothetical protein
LLLAIGIVIFFMDVYAQVVSVRLGGVVRAQSGATIAGAKVSAVAVTSRAQFEVATNDQGSFLFPSLPPGEFDVTIQANGFRRTVFKGIILNTNDSLDLSLTLQPGETSSAPISKNASGMTTIPDSQILRTFPNQDITLLPQLQLAPVLFSVFQPGVELQGGNEGFSRVNGTRQGSNNLNLDSMDVNDPVSPSLGLSLAANNTNTIDQVRVISAGAKAEYGRNAGAQILLVTRSGSEHWSGEAYNYLQNDAFNANDFINNSVNGEKPKDDVNTFGFTIGGSAIGGRALIFGNYEGMRAKQEIVRNRTVLTSNAAAGIFSWVPVGSTTVRTFNIVQNDPRGRGIDPAVAKILSLLPAANNGAVGDGLNTAGYRFNNPIDGAGDQFTIRVDYNLSAGNRLFFRPSWARANSDDWQDGADATFPGQPSGTRKERPWGFSAGSDWIISPRMVNEFRIGRQSDSISLLRPARLSSMMISGLWTDPLNPDFPSSRGSAVYEVADSLSLSRGLHSFKAGANLRFTTQNSSTSAGIFPDITFGTSYGNEPSSSFGPGIATVTPDERQTFESLYNALLGRMEQVTQTYYSNLQTFQPSGTPQTRSFSSHEFGLFLQDDWRYKKNVSLNLGVRYEYSSVPSESNGQQGVLDQASKVLTSSGISKFTVQPGSQWYTSDKNNFAPRIGIAWDVRGDGSLVIRGGYGLFYDRLVGAATDFVSANTPGFSQTVSVFPNQSSGDVRVSDGIPLPVRPAAPTVTPSETRATSAAIFDPGLRTGYVHQFHLFVQKRLSPDTMVEAGYVGIRGADLFMNVNLNQTKVQGDFLQAFNQIEAFRNNLTPVPATNTLVRLFGSIGGAVNALGGATFDQGQAGAAADTLDRTYYSLYSAAGLSDFYLRNFPQFNDLIVGTDLGRSYYDSVQGRLRRRLGALNADLSYTWSKSLDNISVDGGSFTSPVDNFNVALNKGRSDADRPHVVTAAATYAIPLAKKTFLRDFPEWFRQSVTGWDLGFLGVWESGVPFTVYSGRQTLAAGVESWANYSGSRDIGSIIRSTNGVYWFYLEQMQTLFSFPSAGEAGTAGRNSFRGPRYLDLDLSVMKHIRLKKGRQIVFRGEIYNLLNNANFASPTADLSSPSTFGRMSSIAGRPRTMQMCLRFSF